MAPSVISRRSAWVLKGRARNLIRDAATVAQALAPRLLQRLHRNQHQRQRLFPHQSRRIRPRQHQQRSTWDRWERSATRTSAFCLRKCASKHYSNLVRLSQPYAGRALILQFHVDAHTGQEQTHANTRSAPRGPASRISTMPSVDKGAGTFNQFATSPGRQSRQRQRQNRNREWELGAGSRNRNRNQNLHRRQKRQRHCQPTRHAARTPRSVQA